LTYKVEVGFDTLHVSAGTGEKHFRFCQKKILKLFSQPIWRVNPMNPVVIYSTKGGNTEKVAIEIAED